MLPTIDALVKRKKEDHIRCLREIYYALRDALVENFILHLHDDMS